MPYILLLYFFLIFLHIQSPKPRSVPNFRSNPRFRTSPYWKCEYFDIFLDFWRL